MGEFYEKAILSSTDKSSIRCQRGFRGLVRMLELLQDPELAERDIILSYAWSGLQIANKNGLPAIVSSLNTSEIQAFEDQLFYGEWGIHWSRLCDSTMLKHLLDSPRFRTRINVQDSTGRTLLSWAAKDSINLVKWLCEQEDTDVNLADEDNQTPLMYAARYGNQDIVRTLLERDASSINNKSHKHGYTALKLAAERNHEPVFSLLSNYIETSFGERTDMSPRGETLVKRRGQQKKKKKRPKRTEKQEREVDENSQSARKRTFPYSLAPELN